LQEHLLFVGTKASEHVRPGKIYIWRQGTPSHIWAACN
jgi:hypothetical protein